jgi:hypothetical protein
MPTTVWSRYKKRYTCSAFLTFEQAQESNSLRRSDFSTGLAARGGRTDSSTDPTARPGRREASSRWASSPILPDLILDRHRHRWFRKACRQFQFCLLFQPF